MIQRTINTPEKPVLDRLRERWAEDVHRRSAEQERRTAFYVPSMDLLDAIAALTQQARRIEQLEAELRAMQSVEPHGEPLAYVVTQDVRLVRHGSEYGPAGKWDVLLTRNFDPAAAREVKARSTGDVTIGGAHLASQALDAGLVDECQLFVWPVIVVRGKPALRPRARVDLQLIDERRFDNGVVLLRYRPTRERA